MKGGRIIMAAGAAIALTSGAATMLRAQPSAPDNQQMRLATAKRDAEAARKRSTDLQRAADAERDQAARAKAEQAAVAERIKAAKLDIAAARARIAIIRQRLAARRGELAERQGPIARLIAALQAMARRPQFVALVQPGSTRDMVHVRAMLGTIMPVVKARTDAVRQEIAHVRTLRGQAALAVASLDESRDDLEQQRLAFTKLEARHRARSAELDRRAMFESDHAIALGERARDLVDQMQISRDEADTREALAALPGPLPRPDESDAGRDPREADRSPYLLAVVGQLKTGLGEVSANGVRSRGLTLATWPGAKVIAPAAGTVRYAGQFRSFGNVVIIDHGKGWTTAITGLGAISVHRGDTVRQGAAIGAAPQTDAPRITVELRRKDVPVDMTGLMG
ncbi:peptidoglycan DD-metalloendopeptidase family protein [Stakelama sp. CBK3Z-3]|uniref:Peptidoglycan DD-metalloendopeptidase family protein n=2 Tax=Stakelama flava TaxID=2860338 RepID=A0ABS6XP14_9SPHN|nr:peptidoglycan DD-metalloendopeptidase family protein [Stakelama flava]